MYISTVFINVNVKQVKQSIICLKKIKQNMFREKFFQYIYRVIGTPLFYHWFMMCVCVLVYKWALRIYIFLFLFLNEILEFLIVCLMCINIMQKKTMQRWKITILVNTLKYVSRGGLLVVKEENIIFYSGNRTNGMRGRGSIIILICYYLYHVHAVPTHFIKNCILFVNWCD